MKIRNQLVRTSSIFQRSASTKTTKGLMITDMNMTRTIMDQADRLVH